MKKWICVVLAALLVFLSVPSIPVRAEGMSFWDDPAVYVAYVFNQIGCVMTGDVEQAILNDERMNKYEDHEYQFLNKTTDENGKVTINISQEFVNDVRDMAQDSLKTLNGYYLVEHVDFDIYDKLSTYPNLTLDAIQSSVDLFNSKGPYVLWSGDVNSSAIQYYSRFLYDTDLFYIRGGSDIYSYPDDKWLGSSTFYWFSSIDGFCSTSRPVLNVKKIRGTTGSSFKIFYSSLDLYRYLNYQNVIYVPSTGLPSFPNGLSVPETVFKDTDWKKLNRTIYDAVQDALDNSRLENDGITAEEAEKIINEQIQKLLDAMGSLNEGQNQGNQSLDDILNQITAEGNRQSGWLAKIYNYFIDFASENKLLLDEVNDSLDNLILHVVENDVRQSGWMSKIYDLLDKRLKDSASPDNPDGSGEGNTPVPGIDYSEKLDMIIEQLEESNNILGDIESDTSAILVILGLDTAVNFFDLLFTAFSPVADIAKTKFPTSIPWDVAMVVNAMSKSPEVPVFDIPITMDRIGIDETVHIDLSGMENFSKVSRSMLSLTFVLFLMILTRKLFGGGDGS